LGVVGEMALSKHMGWEMDLSLLTGGDKMDWPGIEAKTTTNVHRLTIKEWQYREKKKPTYYVLNYFDPVNPMEVQILGQILREKFARQKILRNTDHGMVYIVEIFALSSLDEQALNAAKIAAEQKKRKYGI